MRRWLAIVLLVAGLTVAGCGSTSQSRGVTTLTLWARSDESAFISGVVNAFNHSHPHIQIKLTIIPVNNFVQKFGIAVAGGSGPDLASIDVAYMPLFAETGVLANLTDRAHRLPYLNQFDRSHIDNATYRGQLFGLPFSGDASVLFYNTALFRDAGLNPADPPRTWSQIEQDAAKVTATGHGREGFYFSGDCGGCAVFTFLPFVWASGGNILSGSPTQQRPTLNEPQVASALRFYRSMWVHHLVPAASQGDNGATQFTPFESGKVAMFATGGFGVQTLRQDAPTCRWPRPRCRARTAGRPRSPAATRSPSPRARATSRRRGSSWSG